ncbi:hypothetical protein [Acidisphaera sp. S103]|uniref:hypothetical protein n=1 Tax=Acidisphaera sp. S103 TaxID=1747223 RepID=UPI00131B5486|nr:hypothetical protein [Acidisphaera sp. S103]
MPSIAPSQAVAVNRLIETLMKTLLNQTPGVARLRLTRVRGGAEGPNYDVTNTVAARGRWIGAMRQNQPLSDWRDFLPALLAGQCVLHQIVELRSAAPAFGFPSARPSRVMACPVTSSDGPLLGAIFIVWDYGAKPPARAALRALMAATGQLATRIAAVLELCDALARPAPEAEDVPIRQVA